MKGDTGTAGAAGAQGPAGPGVPVGGTTSQVLTKTSATDYATAWQTPAGGGGGLPTTGGTMTGSILVQTTNAVDLGATATRWRKLWAIDGEFTNTPTVGGTALPTFTTADARYLQSATATTTYVPLAGGSVLTGLLGPTTTNTRDLGTTALRWRKLWAVDIESTNAPTINGVSMDTRYALATALTTLAARVTALETDMAGHTHASGTVQNAGGTAILVP